jgi:hypothetical protein
MFLRRRAVRIAASRMAYSCVLLASFSACEGGTSVLTRATTPAIATLPAATGTGCITPATAAQTTDLPEAGSVTGTISVGAFASASAGCVGVTLATGADATLTLGTGAVAAIRRRAAASESVVPPALAQVELSNTYDGQLTWASITLQLPPGSVPAGQYPATITTTIDLGDGQISTSVANFTVTVNSTGKAIVTGPSVAQSLAVLGANTTGLLSIYPPGTVLPSPSPAPLETPTPTSSASPQPSAPPSATPTGTPTSTPIPHPSNSPTPVPGTYTATVTLTPSGCTQFGTTSTTQVFTAHVSDNPPAGTTLYYGWIWTADGTYTIPPPTMMQAYTTIAGPQPTITLVSPNFPEPNSVVGSGGSIIVYLFTQTNPNDGLSGVLQPNGSPATTNVTIAEGAVTCAQEMTRERRQGP